MKILVACEESQAVTIELRKHGHEAYSCDLEPCSGGHPEWHIMEDVTRLIDGGGFYVLSDDNFEHFIYIDKWDMIIAFPPCTHLANSGAAWFEKKRIDGRQQQGIDFFMRFANANCDKIAIENPIGIMNSKFRKPDQIIHPWQFGDNANKSTCLWIKGLPLLNPQIDQMPEIEYYEWTDQRTGKQKRQEMWYYKTRCLSYKKRAKAASKTFPGIAKAMAQQWGGVQSYI